MTTQQENSVARLATKVSTQRRLGCNPRVKDALGALVRAGVNEEILLDRLFVLCWTMACEQEPSAIKRRAAWKSRYAAPPGMTWQQFRGRRSFYIDLANEIRHINASAKFDLERWFPSTVRGEKMCGRDLVAASKRAQLKRDFDRLPTLLLAYARFLELAGTELRRDLYEFPRRPVSARKRLMALCLYVKDTCTSQKCFDHLATLLDEVFRMAGVKSTLSRSTGAVNPETLRRQVNRSRSATNTH